MTYPPRGVDRAAGSAARGLSWLASAGGLGGLRVYGTAVAGGTGMVAWAYANRDVNLPIPLFAAFVFAPFYVVRGFLRHGRCLSTSAPRVWEACAARSAAHSRTPSRPSVRYGLR